MLPQSEYFKLWRVRVIRYFCDICEVEVTGSFLLNEDGYCGKCMSEIGPIYDAFQASWDTFRKELKAKKAVERANSSYIPAGYGSEADYYSTSPGISSDAKPLNRKLVDAMEAGVFGGSKPLCPPTFQGGLNSVGMYEYAKSFDNLANPMPQTVHPCDSEKGSLKPFLSNSPNMQTANVPDVDKNGFSIKHWQEKAAFEEGLKVSDDIARARADGYKGGYEAGYANAKLDFSKTNTPADITSGIIGGALRDGWSNK